MVFDEPTIQTADGGALRNATQPAGGAAPGRPRRRWLKRILLGAVIFALIGWVAGALLLRSWTAKPPAIPANAEILQQKIQEHDGKVWLGQSWVGRREGLLTVYLKGGPFELGYANGVLLRPQ